MVASQPQSCSNPSLQEMPKRRKSLLLTWRLPKQQRAFIPISDHIITHMGELLNFSRLDQNELGALKWGLNQGTICINNALPD